MRKIILTLLALVAATTATLAITSNANAASYNSTPRCMTKAEWNQILSDDDNGMGGMSRDQVTAIVGYAGKVTNKTTYSDGTADVDVDYRQCKRNGRRADAWDVVWINYDNYYYDENVGEYGGYVFTPFQVSYKGSWSTP